MGNRRFVPHYLDLAAATFELTSPFTWEIDSILIRSISGAFWRTLTITSGDGRVLLASTMSCAHHLTRPFHGAPSFPFTIAVDPLGDPESRGIEVLVMGACDAPPTPEEDITSLMRYVDKTHGQRLKRGA